MQTVAVILIALVVGAASVELFSRAWLGFLGVLAASVLCSRKAIRGSTCLSRIHSAAARLVLCLLLLLLVFRVYLVTLGLGTTPVEQFAYFVGCIVRLVPFFLSVSDRISAMFQQDED